MTIEEHLKLFVGRVDAQLLEAVVPKVLKAVDVENSDRKHFPPGTCDTMHYTDTHSERFLTRVMAGIHNPLGTGTKIWRNETGSLTEQNLASTSKG